MKHLISTDTSIPVEKILANWATVSAFIYSDAATVDDLKAILRHEVSTKNRELIVDRTATRLANLVKQQYKMELERDMEELHAITTTTEDTRVGESDRSLSHQKS